MIEQINVVYRTATSPSVIVIGAAALGGVVVILAIVVVVAVPVTLITVKGYQKLAEPAPPSTTVTDSLVGRTGVVVTATVPGTMRGKVRIDNESVTPSLITDNYLQYTFPDDVDTEATHRVAVDVTYTGYGEVRGTATYFNLNDLATGIGSTVTADLRVYPNPATNYVAVEGADVDEISAFSLGGALMGRTTGNRLDVSTYAKGLYILKIKAEGKVQTVKLNVIR